jgi:outer membrane protein OmpA-like peptidoglycan-associated protein
MGPINRIYKLMKKQPDLKFSVEGHTDSDGDEAFNMELSKKRAKTVMDKLISMGISKSRLKYTGWGESKPIDNNATPEGKANNRRVEFVKF